jgi:hypothetical protein
MASFECFGKCEIKRDSVTVEDVSKILKSSLSKHYNKNKISLNSQGLRVKGNLKSILEHAITKAYVYVKIEGKLLSVRVDGTSSLGGLPWVWFWLGLISVWLGVWLPLDFLAAFFFAGFVSDLVLYIICRDRPKMYFEDAFKMVEFELGSTYKTLSKPNIRQEYDPSISQQGLDNEQPVEPDGLVSSYFPESSQRVNIIHSLGFLIVVIAIVLAIIWVVISNFVLNNPSSYSTGTVSVSPDSSGVTTQSSEGDQTTGQSLQSGQAPDAGVSSAVSQPKPEFNSTDKNVVSNGNLPVAADKLKGFSPEALWGQAKQMPVSDITKKIYKSIGKLWKVKGEVYKVEELPPSFGLSGIWTEILLGAENPNTLVGLTTIDFIYKGDSSNANSGDVIVCAGYLIGTYETQNTMGGTVEEVVLVGNYFEKQ